MPPQHRLAWRVATLKDARPETATARTLVLDVPGWPGHLAGQHVIVRLTAADGYTAQRSYSLASAPSGDQIELTVQRLADGEVSPYLTDVMEAGDQVEVRGPIGGWFTWAPPDPPSSPSAPVQLMAGGSGIVPLMSIIRAARGTVPVRLLYSARTPADIIFAGELAQRSQHPSLDVTYLFTRAAHGAAEPHLITARGGAASVPRAAGGPGATGTGAVRYGRIDAAAVDAVNWRPEARPVIYVCGPSGFVAAASLLLVAAGHAPVTVKTERFGPTS